MAAEPHRTRLHSEAMAHDSVPALLRRLVADMMELISNEFAMARREFTEATAAARRVLATAAVALAMLVAGFLAVIAGLILLTMRWLPPWVAAVSIGVVLAAAGLLVLKRMLRHVEVDELRLKRTRRSIRHDVEVITRKDK
jgi:uncharacterized membrane protein YqjE